MTAKQVHRLDAIFLGGFVVVHMVIHLSGVLRHLYRSSF
ncbi:MAG: hypothetical protein ACI9PY_002748 [Ascidiaceihabitans sp.]|jgi:hypothetical protein